MSPQQMLRLEFFIATWGAMLASMIADGFDFSLVWVIVAAINGVLWFRASR